jgi:sarcosine oxidase subunit beta
VTLPRTASIVIIGGGVVGCSIAYHLAGRGVRDVVVLERESVGSGTTSKAAGGIRAQFPTETEIRFSLEAIRVFERFEDEFGVDPGYKKIGYLFLVSDPDDLRGFEARIALQRRLGVDVRVIGPDDAHKLVPALRVDDLVAAVWGPGDGLAGPAEVTNGFAKRARERGVKIAEGVRVTAITRDGDRITGVSTTDGAIAAPVVINAAGPSAATIGRLAGIDIAVHPRRRHIFFTEPFPQIPGPIPLTTDRASGFYFRKEMEQVLLSPGDVEDIGDDFNVPMDSRRVEETVQKAIHRLPILERARIAGGGAASAHARRSRDHRLGARRARLFSRRRLRRPWLSAFAGDGSSRRRLDRRWQAVDGPLAVRSGPLRGGPPGGRSRACLSQATHAGGGHSAPIQKPPRCRVI